MATKPGILTDWPWQSLGTFKYLILAPWVVKSIHSLVRRDNTVSLYYHIIFPALFLKLLHNQLWISYSRYRTARGDNKIVDKGINFDQVDRERNWDDNIILNAILYYVGIMYYPEEAKKVPLWRTDGVILTFLLHAGPVEFLYYWLHRALHHHYLYNRYHSHHHSSIATEPISSVIHPFGEILAYFVLFAIPQATVFAMGKASVASMAGYLFYIDFMNNMGHCNFEFVPKWLFSMFPPLKYLMYTPSFHSLHHTQFRTNYCLFMPFYDYINNTMDKNSDKLYEKSLERKEDVADVVYLTHLTTPDSIYHLQFGLPVIASKPYPPKSTWYTWLLWPFTLASTIITRLYGRVAFVSETNTFNSFKLQTWVLPRYSLQYTLEWQREKINKMIEETIVEADKKGIKVLSLGLLNQSEELNMNGELYVERIPELKLKVVDGSSLAAAIVINSIPHEATQVVITGRVTKVAVVIASALVHKGIQVNTVNKNEYDNLKLKLSNIPESDHYLVHSDSHTCKTWLVGDQVREEEQSKAPKGTLFIPFSQLPPKKTRKDCCYLTTPAMTVPKSFENLHSCESWLPRRVISAWRIAGIVHALEGRNVHECGQSSTLSIEKGWESCLRHGFRPFTVTS